MIETGPGGHALPRRTSALDRQEVGLALGAGLLAGTAAHLGLGPGLLAGLLVLTVLLVCTLRLHVAVGALLFTTPLLAYRQELLGFNLTLQRIFLFLGLLAVLLRLATGRRVILPWTAPVFLLGAYTLLKAIDLSRTLKPDFVLRQISILLVGLMIIALLAAALRTAEELDRARRVFVLAAVLPVLLAIHQFVSVLRGTIPTLPLQQFLSAREPDDARLHVAVQFVVGDWGQFVRVSGSLGGAPPFGEYMAMMLCVVAAQLVAPREIRGRLLPKILAFVVMFGLLATTFSRSAWLCGFIGLSAILLLLARDGRVSIVRAAARFFPLVVLALAVTLVVVNADALRENVLSLLRPTEGRAGQHLSLRMHAMRIFLDHPLIGVGLGNFGALTGQGGELSSAHAVVVTEFAEGGLLGTALLLGTLFTMLGTLGLEIRARARTDTTFFFAVGIFGALTVLIVNNLFLYDTLFRDTGWAVMSLAIVATGVMRRERLATAPAEGVPA